MNARARRADVARKAGVSEATVSRALNDSPLITEPIKQRVREAASALGYVPNRQAVMLARNRTFRLGFVVRSYKSFPPFSRSYFPALLDGAVLGAEERGYSIQVVLDRKHNEYRDLARLVRSREIDGLLMSVTPADDQRLRDLGESGVPFVLINNYQTGMSSVDAKSGPGIRLAVEHAVSLGHRRLGFITGDMNFRNAKDRLDAFRVLAEEAGVSFRVVEGNFSRTSGYRCTGSLLQSPEPPSLIMTSSDREAMGVYDYCREHRIRIPWDVSVIGYDNLYPSMDMTPSLTTVANPVNEAGRVAAHLLADLLEGSEAGPLGRWLETGFVVRESTAKVKEA